LFFMTDATYDLLAIGNALVDVLAHTDDAFIAAQAEKHGMQKGGMMLIDESRAVELYSEMGPGVEVSGGSAGNTMAGFASFGGKGAYIGKVADDQLGQVFAHDMKSQGVAYETTPLVIGAPTGRCMILVTPDGQRTMNTFLGAAVELSTADIDQDMVAASAITYLEGYLFDPARAKEAFRLAALVAHAHKRRVSLSLSDSFCVDRHRDDFLDLVSSHVDILFANEQEIMALYKTDDFKKAAAAVAGKCEVAVLTRGPQGAVIINNGKVTVVNAEKVDVVDTTGAGDQFAAGFLYGFTQGMDMGTCGRLGVLAASEVISHMGPRPEMKYADLVNRAKAA
jgi:sugar/nucleoside kinase (ribokinase family)